MVYKPEVQCYDFLNDWEKNWEGHNLKSNRENHGIVKILSLGHECLYDYYIIYADMTNTLFMPICLIGNEI